MPQHLITNHQMVHSPAGFMTCTIENQFQQKPQFQKLFPLAPRIVKLDNELL